MKKITLLGLVAVLAVSLTTMVGCDNRSQLEKDADKAASKLKSMGN